MDKPASNPVQIYLDVCALCRPFDDQQQVRIRMETSAVELILAHIRQEKIELIVSPVHRIEINAISDAEERNHLLLLLEHFGKSVDVDFAGTRQRAENLISEGLGVADAAHLAFAEAAGADFITVDDRLLKQCRRIKAKGWYGSPQSFCEKEELR